jgi:hypothetical protein
LNWLFEWARLALIVLDEEFLTPLSELEVDRLWGATLWRRAATSRSFR